MNNKIPGKQTLLLTSLIGLLLLSGASVTVAADQRELYRQQWYHSFSAATFRESYENASDHLSFSGVLMKAGANVSRNFAVEVHSGLSFKKSLGVSTQGELRGQLSTSSVYLRGNLNFPDYTLFGLAGMTKSRLRLDGAGLNSKEFDTGPGYGVGVDLFGNNTTAVTFHIIRVLDDDNFTDDIFSLGFSYFFDRLY